MIRIGTLDRAEFAGARRLLESASLPVEDLEPTRLPPFLGAWDGERLVGVVAVEPLGPEGLLRSLAVEPDARSQGVGGRLVAAAEQLAVERGVRTLFLLTTTAENFFARRGWERTPREQAPAAIRQTSEFRSVCPASAAFMRKGLRD